MLFLLLCTHIIRPSAGVVDSATVRLTGDENNSKRISIQKATLSTISAILLFRNFSSRAVNWGKTIIYLRCSHFLRDTMNFDQIREICISQGTVVTFFKCDEQIQSHLNGTLFQDYVFGNHSNWSIFDCFIQKMKSWTFSLEFSVGLHVYVLVWTVDTVTLRTVVQPDAAVATRYTVLRKIINYVCLSRCLCMCWAHPGEPSEMPFGEQTHELPSNGVLDGSPNSPRKKNTFDGR